MKTTTRKRGLRRWFGNRAGNVMIEFAIGSGVLVATFTATFQYGYEFYQYNALYNNVRDAALLGAMYTYSSSTATPDNAWLTAVKNMAVYGNPAGTGNPLLTGLTTNNIGYTVGYVGDPAANPNTFRPTAVTVYVHDYTINAVFGSFTTANKPQVTYPYHGFFNP
jgi:Flp pilus assembly protein TadG